MSTLTQTITEIQAERGWPRLGLRELWAARDLVALLAWRDLRVRYRQAVLGVAWAVLQPILTVAVFSFVITKIGRSSPSDAPFSVFMFAAMLPWTIFAFSLTQAGNSLVANESLLTKVYLPRLAIPIAAILPGLVDFACTLVVVLVLMLITGVAPSVQIIAAPFLMVLTLLTALGVSLWLSAVNVRFRDVRYALPFITQLWFFATPIFYSASIVPDGWRALYSMNPMVGVVEGFRWAILGEGSLPGSLIATAVTATFLLITGAYYFRSVERTFADVV